ncbi:uncharacterized protein LOC115999318 [Ipomoea triloba]|uniref:uncharacterized protein LOC115999318 n=1 Tax=Ipomoea triloba TaxID=35885 RepID=UPI00125DA42F|nr:uncharacterized protein LOC115999318 [Ipomoea triloba]XP_031095098.1 uncharacterized protein LOC115999318 [Ipomoea triloba]XP_031095137.1 uncharacterized protein LOC115999318 [Ipomoea triloba]
MGGVCAGGTARNRAEGRHERSSKGSKKSKSVKKSGQENKDTDSYEYSNASAAAKKMQNLYDSGDLHLSISRELKPSTPVRTVANKAPHGSSFIGKAGIVGLEKAVEVLDTLGSSMTNLNNSGFITGAGSRGNKIFILAFEVANTITKGASLLQSLSEESIQYLKEEILHLQGVQELVSTDMKELLAIAAADKREEFDVFSREVIRFGNMCKDPQWHNLDRFFSKLDSDPVNSKQLREEAEMTMQELATLAQHTSELYHEMHTLDRFEQDYRRQVDELLSLNLPRKGESLEMLHSELKQQRKAVRGLRKKSLWAKGLEEVVEKLVDIVTFVHHEINNAFGDSGLTYAVKDTAKRPERLGAAGLALHYANLITKIDNIASCPTSLPPNTRDTLYNGLPSAVKAALRSQLQALDTNEELTVPQIKAEMEKTLQWLVPVATDTTKAHQGFGWVGEWANTGNDFGKKADVQSTIIRLQTLYHAQKNKMDSYILELVSWLHRLITLVRFNGHRALAGRSPAPKRLVPLHPETPPNSNPKVPNAQLSAEDRGLLEGVMKSRKLVPGLSKSQELVSSNNKKDQTWSLSRSAGNSPCKKMDIPKANALDILDGLA